MTGTARIALVLIGEPEAAARAALPHLRRLAAAGYSLPMESIDAHALIHALRGEPEALKLIDYTAFLGALPPAAQASVRAHWGAPERDPAYVPGELDCGSFLLSVARTGPLAIGLEPARGPFDGPPCHAFLAFQAWLRDAFRADTVIPVCADESLDDEWRRLALGSLAPSRPDVAR